ncbi:acyltransferase family protein [Gryllotalpicola ginsengisoli]|uniref:acyltransferase family protein n=1 Tax=Gryllotalpicola ginsengisoli TaxID=444608 RepID=UPI0003B73681|nr:acyltransferase family protein [Gryllotalpicola ginsengisoli]
MSSPTTPTSPAAPQRPEPKPKKRVPFWDNARWIAVTMVVIGHAVLKLIAGSDLAYAFYLFVYTFQVPVLVLVSGYFAKADPPSGRQLKRLITDVVIPYVVFQSIWIVIQWVTLPTHPFSLDYSAAKWTLWFLIALAIWRLVLPYLAMLKFPFLISVAISFVSGYASNTDATLSLSRVAALLPFFVLGWELRRRSHLSEAWLAAGTKAVWWVRSAAIAVLLTAAVTMYLGIDAWRDLLIRRFLLFDEEYSSFGYDQWWAGFVRLLVIALALIMTAAVLVLVPRRGTVFTPWGGATMYIYLLHSFFLYPLRESGWLEAHNTPLVLIGVVLLSIAISVLLSQPFVKKALHPLVEPKAAWLFHKRRAPA